MSAVFSLNSRILHFFLDSYETLLGEYAETFAAPLCLIVLFIGLMVAIFFIPAIFIPLSIRVGYWAFCFLIVSSFSIESLYCP